MTPDLCDDLIPNLTSDPTHYTIPDLIQDLIPNLIPDLISSGMVIVHVFPPKPDPQSDS
jgi:hypothetical protein